mgnify:CR=1 FL=1
MIGSIKKCFQEKSGHGLEQEQSNNHNADCDKNTQFQGMSDPSFVPGAVIICYDRYHSIVQSENRHEDKALQFEIYTIYGCGSRKRNISRILFIPNVVTDPIDCMMIDGTPTR